MLVSNKHQFNLFNKNWQVEATVKRFVFTKNYYLPFFFFFVSLLFFWRCFCNLMMNLPFFFFFVSLLFFEGVFVIWWWITTKTKTFLYERFICIKISRCPDNCPRGKLPSRVWFRVRVRIRFGRQFSTGAIALESNINILLLRQEAVPRRYSVKKEFLKFLQNWHENTFLEISFLITLHAWGFSMHFAKF